MIGIQQPPSLNPPALGAAIDDSNALIDREAWWMCQNSG